MKCTDVPTYQPTNQPTYQRTNVPTNQPTNVPTYQPTNVPTYQRTNQPQPTNHNQPTTTNQRTDFGKMVWQPVRPNDKQLGPRQLARADVEHVWAGMADHHCKLVDQQKPDWMINFQLFQHCRHFGKHTRSAQACLVYQIYLVFLVFHHNVSQRLARQLVLTGNHFLVCRACRACMLDQQTG